MNHQYSGHAGIVRQSVVGGNGSYPQVQQPVRHSGNATRRYTSLLPVTEQRFNYTFLQRLSKLAWEFGLESASAESRALDILQRRALRCM